MKKKKKAHIFEIQAGYMQKEIQQTWLIKIRLVSKVWEYNKGPHILLSLSEFRLVGLSRFFPIQWLLGLPHCSQLVWGLQQPKHIV